MIPAFESLCGDLEALIEVWEARLSALPEGTITGKRNRQDRSIKQIVGHMVDSATNNTHRIIHMHYQKSPVSYPDYANLGNNDRWIAIQNYQDESWDSLVILWAAVNRHFVHLVRQVKEEKLGQFWVTALGEEVTLKDMIGDYPRHLNLHLGEIEALL